MYCMITFAYHLYNDLLSAKRKSKYWYFQMILIYKCLAEIKIGQM